MHLSKAFGNFSRRPDLIAFELLLHAIVDEVQRGGEVSVY